MLHTKVISKWFSDLRIRTKSIKYTKENISQDRNLRDVFNDLNPLEKITKQTNKKVGLYQAEVFVWGDWRESTAGKALSSTPGFNPRGSSWSQSHAKEQARVTVSSFLRGWGVGENHN